jgi:hypothetical protein
MWQEERNVYTYSISYSPTLRGLRVETEEEEQEEEEVEEEVNVSKYTMSKQSDETVPK